MRKAVAVVGLGVYAVYLIYRGLFTLNPDALAFSLAVYLAEIHGFFSLAFYFFQIWELRRRTVPPAAAGLAVDVFITTYDEDVDLLRQTVRGAINMRYPHRTFVLDDGRRPEVRALCAELGCEYITPRHQRARKGRQLEQRLRAHLRRADRYLRRGPRPARRLPRADARLLRRSEGWLRAGAAALSTTSIRCSTAWTGGSGGCTASRMCSSTS